MTSIVPTDWRPDLDRLLTPAQAALAVQRPPGTIRRWIAEGRLRPTIRRGRRALYREGDVDAVDLATYRRGR